MANWRTIKKMRENIDDISFEFLSRIRKNEDELGIIIKGHLIIEYIINQIILNKCKDPQKILKDNRIYSFSVKLQLVYSMGLIPDFIYLNIQRINKIRNQLAHNLDVKIMDDEINEIDKGKMIKLKMVKKKARDHKYYLKMLCFHAISELRFQCFYILGNIPKYKTKK